MSQESSTILFSIFHFKAEKVVYSNNADIIEFHTPKNKRNKNVIGNWYCQAFANKTSDLEFFMEFI